MPKSNGAVVADGQARGKPLIDNALASGETGSLPAPPYPWCHGSPTKEDCAKRGYCNRDPNCGE